MRRLPAGYIGSAIILGLWAYAPLAASAQFRAGARPSVTPNASRLGGLRPAPAPNPLGQLRLAPVQGTTPGTLRPQTNYGIQRPTTSTLGNPAAQRPANNPFTITPLAPNTSNPNQFTPTPVAPYTSNPRQFTPTPVAPMVNNFNQFTPTPVQNSVTGRNLASPAYRSIGAQLNGLTQQAGTSTIGNSTTQRQTTNPFTIAPVGRGPLPQQQNPAVNTVTNTQNSVNPGQAQTYGSASVSPMSSNATTQLGQSGTATQSPYPALRAGASRSAVGSGLNQVQGTASSTGGTPQR